MLLPYFKNIFLHIICGHFNPQAFIPSLFWKSLDYILFTLYKSVLISTDTSACLRDQLPGSWQGCNHGWKVEKDQRPGWVLGARGGRPFPLWGSGGFAPGKFVKTQMLNPAFWWLLAVKFLAFWKLRPRSWGTNTLLVPKPKSWGPVSPGPCGCCVYGSCCWASSVSFLTRHYAIHHPFTFPLRTHLFHKFFLLQIADHTSHGLCDCSEIEILMLVSFWLFFSFVNFLFWCTADLQDIDCMIDFLCTAYFYFYFFL